MSVSSSYVPKWAKADHIKSVILLLTPTIVAVREYSDHPRLCVCLQDKTKRLNPSPNLIVHHHDTSPNN